jgi:integrase
MARASRHSALETRTGRDKLKAAHEPYWVAIGQGLYLGYRKNIKGSTWFVRCYIQNKKYIKQKLGKADDYQDANGIDVLNYFQAQERARHFANEQAHTAVGKKATPITVKEAMEHYLKWFKAHRKSYDRTEHAINIDIIPALGDIPVKNLTSLKLREWHQKLASMPARLKSNKATGVKFRKQEKTVDGLRKRKATTNRVLTVLKAGLNHAWRDGLVESDEAWRKVKPFHNVDSPKIRYLDLTECERLINATEPAFKPLIRAALLTGGRYGELIKLTVNDFDAARGTIHIRETKNGKPRHIPLTEEGRTFFENLTVGKLGKDYIFAHANGMLWGTSHQARRLRDACKAAKIEPAISFHILRHTYGSLLASRGVPLQVIAELLGHSDTRITSRHYAHLMPSFVSDTLRANLPTFIKENESLSPIPLKKRRA